MIFDVFVYIISFHYFKLISYFIFNQYLGGMICFLLILPLNPLNFFKYHILVILNFLHLFFHFIKNIYQFIYMLCFFFQDRH